MDRTAQFGVVGFPTLLAGLLFAAAAGASPAPDETVEIPVRDLVAGVGPAIPPGTPHPRLTASGGSGGWILPTEEDPSAAARGAAVPGENLVEVLSSLGAADGVPIQVRGDRLVVPASTAASVRAALARIRALRPGPIDLEYAVEASADGRAWSPELAGREPVLPGEMRVFTVACDRAYLADFDVEIATASDISDPIMDVQRTGTTLALCLLPLPSGSSAVVDAEVRIAEPLAADPIQARHPDMAPIDRAAVTLDGARMTFRAEAGRETAHEWTGRDGRRIRLRLIPRWTPPPADAGGPGALLWSPLLTHHLVSRRQVGYRLVPAGSEADERWKPFGETTEMRLEAPDRAATRMEGRDARATDPTPGGLVAWSGADAAAGRDALAAALDEECRSFRATAVATEVAAGAAGPGGGREIFRASGPLLADLGACFLRAEARTFLQDADVEVATASSTVDPTLALLQTGVFCSLRVISGPDAGPASVDLDLQASRLESMGTVVLPLRRPSSRAAAGEWKDEKGKPREVTLLAPGAEADAAPGSYALEMPRVREVRLAGLLPLDAEGRAVLRRTVPGFLGEGKELLVEIEVK